MIDKSMLPINVCAYSNENRTFYRYTERKINIGEADSHLTSDDRPMNREWHEFGHFLHHSLVGTTTYDDTGRTRRRNHGGIMNDTTGDSLLEGFAEATSIMILRILKLRDTCCSDLRNHLNGTYKWGNGVNDLENEKFRADTAVYEYKNPSTGLYEKVDRNYIRCVNGKLIYVKINTNIFPPKIEQYPVRVSESDEEFGTVGLLLDLLDNNEWYEEINKKDDNDFSFSKWQDLFCLLKDKKIKNIKELYEALRDKFTDSSTRDKIDKIFIDHGFFQDKNFNGVHDSGEKIGITYRCEHEYKNVGTISKIEERPNQPLIPQASILVNLVDSNGNELKEATLLVEVLSFDGKVNFYYDYLFIH